MRDKDRSKNLAKHISGISELCDKLEDELMCHSSYAPEVGDKLSELLSRTFRSLGLKLVRTNEAYRLRLLDMAYRSHDKEVADALESYSKVLTAED